jgi:hypothetical protein
VSATPVHEPVVDLVGVLDEIDHVIASAQGKAILLGELESSLQGRGAGVLVLVLSIPFLVPVSIPLLSTVCGLPVLALGLRIAITTKSLLPDFARARTLGPEAAEAIAAGLRRILRPIAWAFRPRLGLMFWPVSWRLTGLGIALAAAVMSLPIPVPFGNTIPALALIHFAAGLLQRDGAAICVGHALTLATFVYLYIAWDIVMAVVQRLTGA